ncbi:GyrI-like domain-containing protein [bacterium]|nr:GyrI-like domain-containing protein [bacterium]
MSYIESINRAIDFIERNLKKPIQVEDIASAAYYSKYHFQRLFSLLTGETVGSYLRKRRLTEAANELVNTDRNIIDIALDYQFHSQESFGRSFKDHFGNTPYHFRRGGHPNTLHLYKPLESKAVSHLSKGLVKEPNFETMSKTILIGMSYFGNNQPEIKELWSKLGEWEDQLKNIIDPCRRYGLVLYGESFAKSKEFGYLASFELKIDSLIDLEKLPFEFSLKVLPAARYAVFVHRGAVETIPYSYEYIYGTWLSQSEFDLAAPFDFEFYYQAYDPLDADSLEFSINIPIELL